MLAATPAVVGEIEVGLVLSQRACGAVEGAGLVKAALTLEIR
jgi:hypothetical protein